ncbi:MAG: glutamine-hydrolyzing GMP synthase [Planctomycetota bacterium]
MAKAPREETILILDFGSQYAQLIARRVRELKVYARILPCQAPFDRIREVHPLGIILSGGPANVYGENAPRCAPEVFRMGVPVLGICYGAQLLAEAKGGEVRPAESREYGLAKLIVSREHPLFDGLPRTLNVWMSHGDQVERLPPEFETLATTATCTHAAIGHVSQPFFGVQFHPEVHHTPQGRAILKNFLYRICRASGTWRMADFIEESVREIRARVGADAVVLGLSGGVDSSVVALLLHKAIGGQLTCIFVDNGLLREDEARDVEGVYRDNFHLRLLCVDARERFLRRLAGIADPEEKRKAIGHEFIDVFQETASRLPGVKYLAQGTLYPDVIESVAAHGGPTAVIKSHHNVGGLPETMGLQLIEPLRELFKDEVREIGLALGLPEEIVWRHPFPGPGLAVRILGAVSAARVAILQAADRIVVEEIRSAGLYRRVWQAFAVLLPVHSVGVMGDERTYENVIALRVVESADGMTADWAHLPYETLARMSTRIINEVKGVNRVVYDVSQKPPATIEWE